MGFVSTKLRIGDRFRSREIIEAPLLGGYFTRGTVFKVINMYSCSCELKDEDSGYTIRVGIEELRSDRFRGE